MNKNVISSFVGAGFFAVGYLGLSLALPPALALGVVSFVASELIVTGADKKIEEKKELSFNEKINEARKDNKHIKEIIEKIDDETVQKDLDEITKSTTNLGNSFF